MLRKGCCFKTSSLDLGNGRLERADRQDKHSLEVLENEAVNEQDLITEEHFTLVIIETYPPNEHRLWPPVLLNYEELVPEPAPPVARARPPIFRLRDPLCVLPRPLQHNAADTCLQMEVRKARVLL